MKLWKKKQELIKVIKDNLSVEICKAYDSGYLDKYAELINREYNMNITDYMNYSLHELEELVLIGI
jgi:hypothetical protein